MKIFIACDHTALDIKKIAITHLQEKGYEVIDLGPFTDDSVDYPFYAQKVSEKIVQNSDSLGVLICGTGVGMSIAANKIKGIRAAVVSEPYSARLTREHNDANIICFGARVVGEGVAKMILDEFFDNSYLGDRHGRRVQMISELEKNN